jgi:hypothetical protein
MDWGAFRALREEWPTVKLAPGSFILIALVAAAVGFAVSTLWWSGTVSALRERLSFAQDKLQVALANPANPAALLTKSQDQGRHLSDSEKRCIISKFKDATKDFPAVIISAFPNDEAQKFANDFLGLFLRMGYQSGILPGKPMSYGDTGIIIGMKDPKNPSDKAKRFKELIGACITLNERELVWDITPAVLLPQLASIDFDLFIGPSD